MKWFKHDTDAHMNLKLQSVIDKFGLHAYGYYWACVELVAKEGEENKISAKKEWKMYFKKFLNIEIEMQDTFLQHFADLTLIDKKALSKGDLYIPKLSERADDYTNKVRRKSEQCTDKVLLEQNRIEEEEDKNRIDKKRTDKVLYGELEKVLLTPSEYQKLVERIGESNTNILIAELDIYIASKGKRYSSHYATLLNWAQKKFSDHKEKLLSKGKGISA